MENSGPFQSATARTIRHLGERAPVVPDGSSLRYAARDGFWPLPRLTGHPVQIAGPL